MALVLGIVDVAGSTGLPGGLLLGLGAGLLVLGLGAVLGARLWRGSRAEKAAAGYRLTVAERVREVVRRDLADPTTSVLERHRTLRLALAAPHPR